VTRSGSLLLHNMSTRRIVHADLGIQIGPGWVEQGYFNNSWRGAYYCQQRMMPGKTDIEVITDQDPLPGKRSFGSKGVDHMRTIKEAFTMDLDETHPGNLSSQYRYLIPGGHWESWSNAFNTPYFWGLDHANLDYRWPSNDSHMVNVAVSNFFSNVNEVDGVLNIIEAPDLIPGCRSFIDRLTKPIDHPSNRQIVGRHSQALAELRGLRKRSTSMSSSRRKLLNEVSLALEEIRELQSSPRGTTAIRTTTDLIGRVWTASSAGILTWSFAIAPLVADCKKVMRALPGLQDRLSKLTDKDLLVRTSHLYEKVPLYRLILSKTATPGVADFMTEGTATNNYVWWFPQAVGPSDGEYRVTVRGSRPAMKSVSQTLQSLDYLLRRFGSRGPATIAWELIPFSFVAEWFVNVDSLLGSIDGYLTRGYQVDDICISKKYSVYISITHIGSRAGWFGTNDGVITGYVKLERYTRVPWMGGYDPVFFNSRFGKKQGILTAALLTEQLRANLTRYATKR